jgi:hypothetical protein
MDGFRDAVEVCGFADLGYVGLPWTWINRLAIEISKFAWTGD